jgi:hypothetical protein
MSQQIDEPAKLRFEFYKNFSALTLAALAGAIALINSAFSNAGDKYFAFISIACFICSAICIHGAQEVLLNRFSQKPNFSTRIARFVFSPRWHTTEAEYVLSGLSGTAFGLGLVLFGLFVFFS